jgi:serine/threonine protein kinase
MATVHLARDLEHDRPVALKVLHPDLAHALGSERFQREIRFAARLQQSEPALRELRAGVEALPKVPEPAAIAGLASRPGDA